MSGLPDQNQDGKEKHDMLGFWRPTESWVRVHLRNFGEHCIPWNVQRRGDPVKGTVMLTAQESEDRWCIFTQICTTCEDVYWMRAHGAEFLSNQQATCYLDETIAKDPDVWIIQTGMSVISRIDRQSA